MSFDIFGNSGRRKGTIRKERGFFGDTSYVTRDNYGRKKSTTRKETGFFGDTSYVTRDEIITEEKNQQQEKKQIFLEIQVM